ncbi:MAG TPA: hydantoinase/carbamoylase family amidase [Solirubrobacteraceae bacterium]|nr:hydantoinase/carbamoylase family amidase [Solirubrobacteraceae bacterium]
MIDAGTVIARLRETDARSGGRREAWTEVWAAEREQLDALARAATDDVLIERDAFANSWYVLPGETEEIVLVSSHSDCVPGGGWLDGILGAHAAIGVLESVARDRLGSGARPRRTLAVADWADEEGTRFGRSLLGSSAATGALSAAELDALTASDGTPARGIVAAHGFDADALGRRSERLAHVVAALELHIEQGSSLERERRAVAAVSGCLGVRRSRIEFDGVAGHAGSTPMQLRADPVRAAAAFVQELFAFAQERSGLATVGRIEAQPAFITAVPARCVLDLDLRHAELAGLEEISDRADELLEHAEPCTAQRRHVYAQDPVGFDPELVAAAARAAGADPPVRSGPLHDTAALAQAGIPAAMLFTSSIAGVSHARAEDTPEPDLAVAIEALERLVRSLLDG